MNETQDINPTDKAPEQAPGADTPARGHKRGAAPLPASVVGGLAGMAAGTLPPVLWFLVFRASFSPTFIFLPLFVCLGLKLFRGYDGRRGLAFFAACSLAGFYLTLLSVEAAAYVTEFRMLPQSIPFVTVTLIGQRGALASAAISTAYVLPLVFWLLGVFPAAVFLLQKKAPAPPPEPGMEDGAASTRHEY